MSTFSLFAATAASGQAITTRAAMSVGSTIYGIMYFIFMSAVILGAAYLATKYLARKGLSSSNNKNLKVIETVPLGIDKSLMLVKVGEQYLLLGNTQKNISFLSNIDHGKLSFGSSQEMYGNVEGESIETYIDNLQGNNDKASMSSIKHNLAKLKSIVRGNKIDV